MSGVRTATCKRHRARGDCLSRRALLETKGERVIITSPHLRQRTRFVWRTRTAGDRSQTVGHGVLMACFGWWQNSSHPMFKVLCKQIPIPSKYSHHLEVTFSIILIFALRHPLRNPTEYRGCFFRADPWSVSTHLILSTAAPDQIIRSCLASCTGA